MVIRALLLIFLVATCEVVAAQQNIDVGLTIEYVPSSEVRVGEIVEIRTRVTNYSTVALSSGVLVDTSFIDPNFFIRDQFSTVNSIVESCAPDILCPRCLRLGILQAGESRYCFYRLRAVARGQAPSRERFSAMFFTAGIDSNPDNNTQISAVSIIGETLQAPMSIVSYFTMALLVLGVGLFAARRG
jgi:hypothetical protein